MFLPVSFLLIVPAALYSNPISMFLPVSFFINCAGRTLLQSYQQVFTGEFFLLIVPAELYFHPIEHVFTGECFY